MEHHECLTLVSAEQSVSLLFYFKIFSLPSFSLPPKEDMSTRGTTLTKILVLKPHT